MRSFELGRRFDAVTCLFSAIGYMLRRDDLDAAMATMARHLEPGGVLVVEPWFHPDGWIDGHVGADTANGPGIAVARVSRGLASPDVPRARRSATPSLSIPDRIRVRRPGWFRSITSQSSCEHTARWAVCCLWITIWYTTHATGVFSFKMRLPAGEVAL